MILNTTRVFKVRADLSGSDDMVAMRFAADILRKGGLVAFPTETVYGLGANALDEKAVEKIFEAKGRPQDNPLIVHLSSYENMHKYCDTNNLHLSKLYPLMPGPITVVLPKKDIIPSSVCAGNDSVGIRVPLSLVARRLIELAGVPVAAPSANISGKPSPTSASHVVSDLFGKVDVIIDAGNTTVGLESTVVTLCTEVPTVLRPGGITYEALCKLLGNVNLAPSIVNPIKDGEKVAAPGMKYRHYAPNAPVYLLEGSEKNILKYMREAAKDEKCAVLCYDEDMPFVCGHNMLSVGSCQSAEHYAKSLFDALRKTDEIASLKAIYARVPKNKDGISLAVYNRLLKASGFNKIDTNTYKGSVLIIGLTGPTGAGKGVFCNVAKKMGCECIDTDKIGHEIMLKGCPAYFELLEAFGRKILDQDKKICRKKLAEVVFSSKEDLDKLNKITHKYISKEVCKIICDCEQKKIHTVIIDAPVLFESDIPLICDYTIGVLAPAKQREKRIIDRDGLNDKAARVRMENARTDSYFIEKCDYIIKNDSSISQFEQEAQSLLFSIIEQL